ncbi:MAG: ABC transporter substrate-binding protein [Campylobacterota bacterium]|nr:ABC transporter substrate-binding protein [Campylobacterota bacterium]
MSLSRIFYVVLIVLVFINNLYGNKSQNKKEFQKVSLQLQWLDQFQFAGYYVAKEKGFYKDVGLDVEIKKYKHDILTIDEVKNKKATYGIGRSSLIINKSNGAKIKLLASIFQSSPLILLTTKKSGIKI